MSREEDKIKNRAEELGVEFVLSPTKQVRMDPGGINCSGYFVSKPFPKLAVATGREDWLLVLLHESQHMEQWAEGAKEWKDAMEPVDVWDHIGEWLKGKDVPSIEHYIDVAQQVEIDCEKRTVEVMKGILPPSAVENYVRNANSYILYYPYMRLNRQWYTTPPYDVPEIVERMPITFMDNEFYRNPPQNILKLFKLKSSIK